LQRPGLKVKIKSNFLPEWMILTMRILLARFTSVFKRSKLSTIMVACFIFLNLLVLLAIIGLAYQAFSKVTFTEISTARLALLNESTKRGFDFITNVSGIAFSTVSNKEIAEKLEGPFQTKFETVTNRREISDILHHTLVVNAGISSIEIYSDQFNESSYSATDLVYPIDRISGKSWFSKLKNADAIWVSEQENDLSNSLIGYAQHIFNSKGETIGYLLIGMSAKHVLQKFADVPMALDGQVLLVDTAGKVIVQVNDPSQADQESVVDANWLHTHSEGMDDGYGLYKKGNRTYLVFFSKPSTVQWRLVQIIPVSLLLSSTQKAGWYVLGVGILSLLVAALLAYLFVKNMITPLRRLVMEMKKLERGDFRAQMKSGFTEEYVHLSFGFNHMVSRLRELMESVKTENRAKREAQTSLLEAQIKPHFLYNTLDMIHWRALDYHAHDISFMITQLGKLLRIGLSGGKMFIRVRDELEHASCYISIQQKRLPFAIDFVERIDPRIKSYYIPKIILQPMIENSVMHAKPEEKSQPLQIVLDIRELHPAGHLPILEISLTDNGKGFPDNWDMHKSTGIGIRNVHNRIQLYCGPMYGLNIVRAANNGASVTIRLPVIETEQQLKRWLDGENL
jgi:two-component system sensor histidine kinase YesM